MSTSEKENAPRFLYRPWRIDSTLMVVRHLIVREGPKRIVVQRAPYDQFSEEFRRTKPLVYVDRYDLKRLGYFWRWFDPEFELDKHCPLGRLYATEDAARFALHLWASTALNAVEVNPASLN